MATTALKLSSKTDANGKSQVIVKLTISRQNRPCFKSGVYVRPEWFRPVTETKKGWVYDIVIPKKGKLNVLEVEEAKRAKSALDTYVGKLTTVCNALVNGESDASHESIEKAMLLMRNVSAQNISYNAISEAREKEEQKQQGESLAKDFFGWLDYYLLKNEVSEGRKKGFKVLVRILARYQSFVRLTDKERRNFTLDVHTLDRETLEDFFDYMRNEKSLSEEYPEIFAKLLADYPAEFSCKHKHSTIEERGRNMIIGRKKQLKAFFNWMIKGKFTTNQPFDGVTIGTQSYGTPFYLTIEERNAVAEWDFTSNKHLEVLRDIFIFQSLVGCRVSDLLQFTQDNIVMKEGVENIEYIPRKTKDLKPVVVDVPLNNRAKALVEKYKGVDKKGRLFPFVSREKYNDAIKVILTKCGIKRMVSVINPTTGKEEQRPINEMGSSHMARRGFIGNLYKKVSDPNLIGKLSGHTEGSRAFARYRDIDMDMMKNTVSLID